MVQPEKKSKAKVDDLIHYDDGHVIDPKTGFKVVKKYSLAQNKAKDSDDDEVESEINFDVN